MTSLIILELDVIAPALLRAKDDSRRIQSQDRSLALVLPEAQNALGFGIGEIVQAAVEFASAHQADIEVSLLAEFLFTCLHGAVRKVTFRERHYRPSEDDMKKLAVRLAAELNRTRAGKSDPQRD
jgi:hypothetical protein